MTAVSAASFFGSTFSNVSITVWWRSSYVPGSTYYTPAPAYYGMYGYYNSSYAMVHDPGYYQENTIVKLETNVYDVASEKLVWSGVTETLNPETAQDVANSVAFKVTEDMVKSKVIRK